MDTHWKFLQTSLENKIGPNCIGIRSQINSQYFALVNQGIKKKILLDSFQSQVESGSGGRKYLGE